jgi:hypothetical protein
MTIFEHILWITTLLLVGIFGPILWNKVKIWSNEDWSK